MLFFNGQLQRKFAPATEIHELPQQYGEVLGSLQSVVKSGSKLPLKKSNPPPATAARV
jgi:hypothetical protein